MNSATAVTPSPRHAVTSSRPVLALVGNPNTGKTTLFNALCGMRQRVGNYPGVTVEMKRGQATYQGQTFEVIDLPGTYSLAPRSPDEMVAVALILGQQPGEHRPDVVVSIVDASNLERNLYLTTQALDLGVPVVVALNMIDIAQKQGQHIDADRLAKQLGVPVVPVQANKGKGLEALLQAAAVAAKSGAALRVPFPETFEREVAALQEQLDGMPAFLVRRLLLDVGGHIESKLDPRYPVLRTEIEAARVRLGQAGCGVPGVEARTRYAWIRQALRGCVERPAQRPVTWTDRIDRVLTHKFWGTLVFLALMFVVFQSIFTWARPLMKVIGAGKDFVADGLRDALPAGPVSSLLTDGVLEGVGGVLVFLPQIVILFGFIAVLEDCGYMARAAFLMDRVMARCGLSGKSFIPLLSSVACAVPGIMAARVIEDRRDRLATILVAPLMSCSARLPVYILLTAAFLGDPWWLPGVVMFGLYALGLVAAPLVALALKRTLLRGETPVFVMEMPLYKVPSPRTVARRMTDSAWAFLRRAGTLILASMVLVWALLYFPHTDASGMAYDIRIAAARQNISALEKQRDAAEGDARAKLEESLDAEQAQIDAWYGEWKRQSWLGQMGRGIEPAVRPLGWDGRIGMAALASFPAREVVVGTLGIIYNVGKVDSDELRAAGSPGDTKLAQALRKDAAFSVPVALSLLVFFALCCQCASTLAVIKRETASWRWPAFTFVYMTALAYVAALVVFQAGRLFS